MYLLIYTYIDLFTSLQLYYFINFIYHVTCRGCHQSYALRSLMASTSPFTFMSANLFFVFVNCFMWDGKKINLNFNLHCPICYLILVDRHFLVVHHVAHISQLLFLLFGIEQLKNKYIDILPCCQMVCAWYLQTDFNRFKPAYFKD